MAASCRALRRAGRALQSPLLRLEVAHRGPCSQPCSGMESLGKAAHHCYHEADSVYQYVLYQTSDNRPESDGRIIYLLSISAGEFRAFRSGATNRGGLTRVRFSRTVSSALFQDCVFTTFSGAAPPWTDSASLKRKLRSAALAIQGRCKMF